MNLTATMYQHVARQRPRDGEQWPSYSRATQPTSHTPAAAHQCSPAAVKRQLQQPTGESAARQCGQTNTQGIHQPSNSAWGRADNPVRSTNDHWGMVMPWSAQLRKYSGHAGDDMELAIVSPVSQAMHRQTKR
jgi:uncharacterized iron-regulated membrane protein